MEFAGAVPHWPQHRQARPEKRWPSQPRAKTPRRVCRQQYAACAIQSRFRLSLGRRWMALDPRLDQDPGVELVRTRHIPRPAPGVGQLRWTKCSPHAGQPPAAPIPPRGLRRSSTPESDRTALSRRMADAGRTPFQARAFVSFVATKCIWVQFPIVRRFKGRA